MIISDIVFTFSDLPGDDIKKKRRENLYLLGYPFVKKVCKSSTWQGPTKDGKVKNSKDLKCFYC